MLKFGPTAAMSEEQHENCDLVICKTSAWHWKGDGFVSAKTSVKTRWLNVCKIVFLVRIWIIPIFKVYKHVLTCVSLKSLGTLLNRQWLVQIISFNNNNLNLQKGWFWLSSFEFYINLSFLQIPVFTIKILLIFYISLKTF